MKSVVFSVSTSSDEKIGANRNKSESVKTHNESVDVPRELSYGYVRIFRWKAQQQQNLGTKFANSSRRNQ